MITNRDRQVINYLQKYKCAHTQTLAMFYPSMQVTRRRLRILSESREIKRIRDNVNLEYVYFISKPKQLRHSLLLTDFLREFSRVAQVEKCKLEFTIGNVRSDALMGFKQKGKLHIAFVEIQIANTPLDVLKYEKLHASGAWKNKLPEFPMIIAVTDKKIPETKLVIKRVNEDLSNLGGLK